MPKARRFKKVSLTKTDKKGLKFKQQVVEDIRSCVDSYENIFLFSVQNMRNGKLKDIRGDWKDSRFFFGKNKVMALGLGKGSEDEYQKNLSKLAKYLIGQCGLLFTNRSKEEVLEFFGQYVEPDYARSGDKATQDVVLGAGPLPDFSHAIEPHLRSLGMPTALQKGVVTLLKDYTVCKEGQILKPAQASILKLLGKQMAEFRIIIKCLWSKDGTFKKFKVKESAENNSMSVETGVEASVKHTTEKKKKKKKQVTKSMDEDGETAEDGENGLDTETTITTTTVRKSKRNKKKNKENDENNMDVS